MRTYSKSGRFLAGMMAVIFLMTSLLTFSVSADVSIAETSTATVAAGETATITVSGANGTEQTTVLVYLGTPDDENIIFIDQKAADNGTAAFTFKVPATAAAGTYTVLAGSESSNSAGDSSLVVTTAGETPDPVVPTLESIAVAADAKVEYTVGDEFVAPTVTATYSDASTKTVEATFTGYDLATAGEQTVTVTYEGVSTTYTITVVGAEPPVLAVVSIAVSDAKTAYTVGDEFVAPTVTATYSDETTETVTAEFSGYDLATAGTQTVTVTYGEVTTTYEITVTAPVVTLVSIAVAADAKVEYTVGDEFVAPEVTATYSDDSTEVVTGAVFEGYDLATAGEQTVTVTYEGVTTTYVITVTAAEPPAPEKTLVSIAVADDAKVAYTVGDEFVAPEVTATYSDDSTEVVTAEFTGYDMATAGEQTVTVTYEGVTTTYAITVTAPVVEDWAVTATFDDDADVVFAGNAFDSRNKGETSADVVKKVSANGQGLDGTNGVGFDYARTGGWGGTQTATTPSTVDWTKVNRVSFYARIIPSDTTTSMKFTMRVNGPNKKCTFTANTGWQYFEFDLSEVDLSTVPTSKQIQWTQDARGAGKLIVDNLTFSNYQVAAISPLLQSIAVADDAKVEYSVGDEFVAPVVTATYSDDTTAAVEATFAGYDMAAEGTQTVTVAYKGFTATYEITVVAPVVEKTLESIAVAADAKVAYTVGDEFVAPVVTATYSDGTTAEVAATFAGYDMAVEGTQTVTVTYEDKTATYEITVTAAEPPAPEKTLESIAVAADAKVEYTVGDEFVAPVVTATYSDGTTATVEATFEGYDLATSGTQTVTVTYEGVTTTYEITVTAVEPPVEPEVTLESIAVAADAVVEYTVGDEFVAPVVTATYSDGTTAEVAATFTGYDMNTAGTQTVTVTFEDVTTTYEITVTAVAEPPVTPDVEVLKSYLDLDFEDAAYAQKDDGTGVMVDDYWNMVTTNKATGNQVTVAFNGTNTGNRYQVYEADGNKYIATKGRKTQIAYDIRSEESVSDKENFVYVEAKVLRRSYNNDDPVSLVVTDANANPIFRLNYKQNVAPVLVADATYDVVTYPINGEWTYIRAIIDFNKSTFELYQGASLDSMTAMVEGKTSFGFASSAADVTRITNLGIGDRKGSLGFDDVKIYTVAPPAKVVDSIAVAADAKVEYFVGDEFVAPIVTAKFTDSLYADEVVTAEFSGYDLATAGTQTVTVTYGDKTTTYEITVIAVVVDSIAVSDAKTEYFVGDEFVAPAVTAKYNNGKEEAVTAEFSGYDLATAGAQTVTVTYGEKTATYDITVTAVALESIAVAADVKVEYTVGDEFVAPVVTAKYNNGKEEVVTATFAGYDLATLGTQTVTVAFEDKTTTYEITVKEPAPEFVAEGFTQNVLDQEAGVVYITEFKLAEGNGTSIVKVGDVELTWSAERECYVGIIAAENYNTDNKALLNVSVTAATEPVKSFTYGDITSDGRINMTDYVYYKNHIELGIEVPYNLAADLNIDGRLDQTDLALIKDHLEKNEPALKENK